MRQAKQRPPNHLQRDGRLVRHAAADAANCLADEKDAALSDHMAIAGESRTQIHNVRAIGQIGRRTQGQQRQIDRIDAAAGDDLTRLIAQMNLAETRLQRFAEEDLQTRRRPFQNAAIGGNGAHDIAMRPGAQSRRQKQNQKDQPAFHSSAILPQLSVSPTFSMEQRRLWWWWVEKNSFAPPWCLLAKRFVSVHA